MLGEPGRSSSGEPSFGPLTAAEVRYLMRHEWARTADDVLWRRTRLGLVVTPHEREALARFMAANDDRMILQITPTASISILKP